MIDQHYKKYLEAFAENLFVGVSNFSKDGYDSASALACNIAKKNNIKAVAINDVLFLEKEDHLALKLKLQLITQRFSKMKLIIQMSQVNSILKQKKN